MNAQSENPTNENETQNTINKIMELLEGRNYSSITFILDEVTRMAQTKFILILPKVDS